MFDTYDHWKTTDDTETTPADRMPETDGPVWWQALADKGSGRPVDAARAGKVYRGACTLPPK